MTDTPATTPEMHPVQNTYDTSRRHERTAITSLVTQRAYEVYCQLYGEQPALMDLAGSGCRGGFGVGELIAFLYARSFPRNEWRARVDEAFKGMKV